MYSGHYPMMPIDLIKNHSPFQRAQQNLSSIISKAVNKPFLCKLHDLQQKKENYCKKKKI